MKLSDKNIYLLTNNQIASDEYENFDAHANQYENFINKIKATEGKEIALRFADYYGLCTYIVSNEQYCLVSAEAELAYQQIADMEELKKYPPQITDIVVNHIIDASSIDAEYLENRLLFTYEIVVPASPDIIFEAIETAQNYAETIANSALLQLQEKIRKTLEYPRNS